jgi:hypothetical protein
VDPDSDPDPQHCLPGRFCGRWKNMFSNIGTVKTHNVVTFFAQNNFFSESCFGDLMLSVATKFDFKKA